MSENEILDDEDTFWGEGRHVDGKDSSFGSVRGNITDLSDLAQMVNLEELALCNQKIEDISGLKELPLKKLYLSKNMITDFSVLLNLIDLDTLCIMENPAENLSVIGECTGILRLNIQGMNLTDIDFLKNLSLDYLDMSNMEVENNIFEPLTEMKKLDTLCMCDVNEAAAETLSQMSTLKALFMWGDSTILENLKPLKGMTQLEITCIHNTDFFVGRNRTVSFIKFPVSKFQSGERSVSCHRSKESAGNRYFQCRY